MPIEKEIRNYYKAGRSSVYQFYITDIEINDVLCHNLLGLYEPYSLICSKWDNKELFHYKEHKINEFLELRNQNYNRFYLRSKKLTPHLEISYEPLNGEQNYNFQKYYVYNGLIDIQHGSKQGSNFLESSIGIINKYFLIDKPEILFENNEYLFVFNQLKKHIHNLLKHKSKFVFLNEKIDISRYNNVSDGFASCMMKGEIVTDFEIV